MPNSPITNRTLVSLLITAATIGAPVTVPILLIGIRSFHPGGRQVAHSAPRAGCGHPEAALTIGILSAMLGKCRWKGESLNSPLRSAVEKAGDILLIIGAGGAMRKNQLTKGVFTPMLVSVTTFIMGSVAIGTVYLLSFFF